MRWQDGQGCQRDVSLQEDSPGPAAQKPSRLRPRVSAGPPQIPTQRFPPHVPLPVSHGCTTVRAERCGYLLLQGPDLTPERLKIKKRRRVTDPTSGRQLVRGTVLAALNDSANKAQDT